MDLSICIIPAAPIRKKASHKVEMVNQLLFGEGMLILKRKAGWSKVQSLHDQYEGWVRNNLIMAVEERLSNSSFVTGELFNKINFNGSKMYVPIGSTLPGLRGEGGEVGNLIYNFKGFSFNRAEIKPTGQIIQQ